MKDFIVWFETNHLADDPGRVPAHHRQTHPVQALHRRMSGTPRQANLTLAILKKMFNIAIDLGWRSNALNPVRGYRKYREEKRERFLDQAEFKRLWQALEAERQNPRRSDGILALQLLVLTGRRKSEILNLTWDEVGFARKQMVLADSKVGAKIYELGPQVVKLLKAACSERQPHSAANVVPFSPDAVRQYAPAKGASREVDGSASPFVICGRKPGSRLVGLQKIWERIRNKAGLADVRLHDLRHSYASMAIANGLGIAEVKELLGHHDHHRQCLALMSPWREAVQPV